MIPSFVIEPVMASKGLERRLEESEIGRKIETIEIT